MAHDPRPGFMEISGPFAKLWSAWGVLLLLNLVFNTPPWLFLISVLIPFLAIEIPGAMKKSPGDENHRIAHTLSEIVQRFVWQSKKARKFPVSWAALGVVGIAGTLAWKTAWAAYHLTPFGGPGDLVTAILLGVTIFAWNVPHWWDAAKFG